ncbi:ryncolin-4-like [Drosophila serrata]|uniref:ryncolin-4-like n=1 Tax=Drosophila serrata TaxID=7274 RepID=UPI000A1D09EB|nr:ryncolin-4-like [Drosophila serrata]
MLLPLLFALLISNCSAIQKINEVCSVLAICDNIALIRSQVADIREEQERQANILEGSALSLESAKVPKKFITKTNDEVCSILSICNNLAALSSELAAVRAEQERQADLLEKSCKADKNPHPANCHEALKETPKSALLRSLCQRDSWRGWTIILRRTDGEDFFREWKDYEEGFGRVDKEYFVGLAKLHALTSSVRQELLVIVKDDAGERYAMYDNVRIGGESNNYTLESLGFYSGTAGDALKYHEGMQFSTKDRDNDIHETRHCAVEYTGAWWYRSCYDSNLAGLYSKSSYGGTIRWYTSSHIEALKNAIMMIRPRAGEPQG